MTDAQVKAFQLEQAEQNAASLQRAFITLNAVKQNGGCGATQGLVEMALNIVHHAYTHEVDHVEDLRGEL